MIVPTVTFAKNRTELRTEETLAVAIFALTEEVLAPPETKVGPVFKTIEAKGSMKSLLSETTSVLEIEVITKLASSPDPLIVIEAFVV